MNNDSYAQSVPPDTSAGNTWPDSQNSGEGAAANNNQQTFNVPEQAVPATYPQNQAQPNSIDQAQMNVAAAYDQATQAHDTFTQQTPTPQESASYNTATTNPVQPTNPTAAASNNPAQPTQPQASYDTIHTHAHPQYHPAGDSAQTDVNPQQPLATPQQPEPETAAHTTGSLPSQYQQELNDLPSLESNPPPISVSPEDSNTVSYVPPAPQATTNTPISQSQPTTQPPLQQAPYPDNTTPADTDSANYSQQTVSVPPQQHAPTPTPAETQTQNLTSTDPQPQVVAPQPSAETQPPATEAIAASAEPPSNVQAPQLSPQPTTAPATAPMQSLQPDAASQEIDDNSTHRKWPFGAARSFAQKITNLNYKPLVSAGIIGMLVFGLFNSQVILGQVQYLTTPSGGVDTQAAQNLQSPASDEDQILIPQIDVNVPVVDEPSFDEDRVQAALEDGVVHYGNTAKPGEIGNSVIVGHSSNNWWEAGDYKYAFILLDRLENGDEIVIDYDEVRYEYEVTDSYIVEPDDLSVLEQPDDTAMLTLITCSPPGTNWQRLIVEAEQVSPDPDENIARSEAEDEADVDELPRDTGSFFDLFR